MPEIAFDLYVSRAFAADHYERRRPSSGPAAHDRASSAKVHVAGELWNSSRSPSNRRTGLRIRASAKLQGVRF